MPPVTRAMTAAHIPRHSVIDLTGDASVVAQINTGSGRKNSSRSVNKPKQRGRKRKGAGWKTAGNATRRKWRGRRLQGQGYDIKPKAYNWFGARGVADGPTKTYAELAGLRILPAKPYVSATKTRKRKTASSTGRHSAVELRLQRLQRELASVAEAMRRRLPRK